MGFVLIFTVRMGGKKNWSKQKKISRGRGYAPNGALMLVRSTLYIVLTNQIMLNIYRKNWSFGN
jgi:uncharacterized membrane protein YidH (DUF202 family)